MTHMTTPKRRQQMIITTTHHQKQEKPDIHLTIIMEHGPQFIPKVLQAMITISGMQTGIGTGDIDYHKT